MATRYTDDFRRDAVQMVATGLVARTYNSLSLPLPWDLVKRRP